VLGVLYARTMCIPKRLSVEGLVNIAGESAEFEVLHLQPRPIICMFLERITFEHEPQRRHVYSSVVERSPISDFRAQHCGMPQFCRHCGISLRIKAFDSECPACNYTVTSVTRRRVLGTSEKLLDAAVYCPEPFSRASVSAFESDPEYAACSASAMSLEM